jgi:[ribosomal protein S18]-alanine N-acetyltransferase
MAIVVDPVAIEPMRRSDVPMVCEIDRRSYPTPWHENAYHTELANRWARYLVARLDGKVVGYGGMWIIMDEAHITTLAVDPPVRGRKIGERLLYCLLEEAIRSGTERATLEVREHNTAAQRLYAKYGFLEAAVRKCYYTDNQENAIVMWAEGIATAEYRAVLDDLRRALYLDYDERVRVGNEL